MSYRADTILWQTDGQTDDQGKNNRSPNLQGETNRKNALDTPKFGNGLVQLIQLENSNTLATYGLTRFCRKLGKCRGCEKRLCYEMD